MRFAWSGRFLVVPNLADGWKAFDQDFRRTLCVGIVFLGAPSGSGAAAPPADRGRLFSVTAPFGMVSAGQSNTCNVADRSSDTMPVMATITPGNGSQISLTKENRNT